MKSKRKSQRKRERERESVGQMPFKMKSGGGEGAKGYGS